MTCNPLTSTELIETDADRRLYYWVGATRISDAETVQLTSDGIEAAYGNPDFVAYVGLSGHSTISQQTANGYVSVGQYDS